MAARHTKGLFPLPTESKDGLFLRLCHALERACDLVLNLAGACTTALQVALLLAVGEDLPACEAHLRVELGDDGLGLWLLQEDQQLHVILKGFRVHFNHVTLAMSLLNTILGQGASRYHAACCQLLLLLNHLLSLFRVFLI